ncbi:MAG: chitobiase/beta-hexosaminidase C-terminal domain-containing protein, partial [Pseudomonadota bacterium]
MHQPFPTTSRGIQLALVLLAALVLLLQPSFAAAQNTEKPRLLVLADIGGDPDDEQSLVRLLNYSNEFKIEGLIAASNQHHGLYIQPVLIENQINVYAQVRGNLLLHKSGFPSADYLLERVKNGNPRNGMAYVGAGHDTDGSNWILDRIQDSSPQPLNISVWGGTTDLAQALWRIRQTLQDQGRELELPGLISKLRVFAIVDQDDSGPWIRQEFPSLFYIRSENPDDTRLSGFTGMYLGGDEELTSRTWIEDNIYGHGPLGELYPDETETFSNPNDAIKEGDTPSWLYFLPNGFNDPSQPSFGSWGGRFNQLQDGSNHFEDARDTPENNLDPDAQFQAAVNRWRLAFQNDFSARMDWNHRSFANANHNPVASISAGDLITVNSGDIVSLDASQSTDPDNDNLVFKWWQYREPGSYSGSIDLQNSSSQFSSFVAPPVNSTETIHIILEVTDTGSPQLTDYRRLIVTVESNGPTTTALADNFDDNQLDDHWQIFGDLNVVEVGGQIQIDTENTSATSRGSSLVQSYPVNVLSPFAYDLQVTVPDTSSNQSTGLFFTPSPTFTTDGTPLDSVQVEIIGSELWVLSSGGLNQSIGNVVAGQSLQINAIIDQTDLTVSVDGVVQFSGAHLHTGLTGDVYLGFGAKNRSDSQGGIVRFDNFLISGDQDTQNQAPLVYAGSDHVLLLPNSGVSLQPLVSDDGLPTGTLTTTWSDAGGSNQVVFDDASSESTIAHFSSPGTYTLQFTVDDGQLQTTDELVVDVFAEGSVTSLPTASPSGGAYVGSVEVTLSSATTNANIYYTLDGSVPDSSCALYSAPFAVMQSDAVDDVVNLRAIAIADGFAPSPVASTEFTITVDPDSDEDSLPDTWEIRFFEDLSQDGSDDNDNDGSTNLQEYQDATDPTLSNTAFVHTFAIQVDSIDDDAVERASGDVSIDESNLDIVQPEQSITGIRFSNVALPTGSTVLSAHLQFTTGTTSSDLASILIRGELTPDSQAFTAQQLDVSSRQTTHSSVIWSPSSWSSIGTAGPDQKTPDLGGIIQEIIEQPNWNYGNNLTFLLIGDGQRAATSFDGSPTDAPILHIEYTTELSVPTVSSPTVFAEPGTPEGTLTVSLSTLPAEATLFYTTDDSSPNESSTIYTGPFSVAADTVINVLGVLNGYQDSAVTRVELGSNGLPTEPVTANFQTRISRGRDDAEETVASGNVNASSSDLELSTDGNTLQVIGLRFQDIAIPADTTITQANIQFTSAATDTGATNLTIFGDANAQPGAINTGNSNISNRTTTSTSVNWSPPSWLGSGNTTEDQRTPDLSSIVQEIIDLPGWQENNNMVFVIGGTGERTAESYNGSASEAALLSIDYEIHSGPGADPQAASPVIFPQGGTFSGSVEVSLGLTPANAEIYYTIDGSTPDETSTLYTAPFSLNTNTTVKAIGVLDGHSNSEISTSGFTFIPLQEPIVATPTISPEGGTFSDLVSVSLSTETADANIYYTLDGSEPGTESTLYVTPFDVIETSIVSAIATREGYENSAVATAEFLIPEVSTPTFSPDGRIFINPVNVSISVEPPTAQIYYTTDGTTPTESSTLYTGPIPLTQNTTINALGVLNGYKDSDTANADFVFSLDTDGDEMPDAWETLHALNPFDAGDKFLDPDGDSLANVDEYNNNTDPNVADPILADNVFRGPYLQSPSQTSVIVRWNTTTVQNSYVLFGTDLTQPLSSRESSSGENTEHEVHLDGLNPDTRYYYQIVQADVPRVLSNQIRYFDTSPGDSTEPARLWIFGDSGDFDQDVIDMRDSFADLVQQDGYPADIIAMLGNNAYEEGTDAEYQQSFFDVFQSFLQNNAIWPVFGNREGRLSSDALTQTGPYFDMFSLPTAGESGGVASGTEAYYSFDYGEIHVVVLDSFSNDMTPGNAMLTWLESDLAANNKLWALVLVHHPPYTSSSENHSDTAIESTDFRENVVPILDAYDVDIVLSAHTNAYERSYLLKDHYGPSDTFDPQQMGLNLGDGREDGDGVYQKSTGPDKIGGVVYIVTGHGSRISNTPFDHPAMYTGESTIGSVVVDIDGDRLDAHMLRSDGTIGDYFTIVKVDSFPLEVTALTISPNGGSYADSVDVTLSAQPAEATIYYTTDGSTPDTSSTIYGGPFTLTDSATVNAIGVLDGYQDSPVASAAFTVTPTPPPVVDEPAISPNGGSYFDSVEVTLSTSPVSATIYYTTDGSTPDTSSSVYGGPFTLTDSATVNAIGVLDGYQDSPVASAAFTVSSEPPPTTTLQVRINSGGGGCCRDQSLRSGQGIDP